MIGVRQLGGGSSEQDNIDLVKYFSAGSVSTSRMVDTINGILQFMPRFEIGEKQSVWFNFLFTDSVTVRYKMVNKGKGSYGLDATPILFSDLHFISSTGTTAADLDENPSTAKFYIDDLDGATISEHVNSKFMGYEIKDKALGETIFKVGIEPDIISYWFVGDSGTYGEGLLQCSDSDFEQLSKSSGAGIQSVTGDLVNSQDPMNPIINRPIATAKQGTVISFESEHIYNLPYDPPSDEITNNLANARIGIIQKIYHRNNVELKVPEEWILISGEYIPGQLNIIYAEWVSGTRVEYWVIRR